MKGQNCRWRSFLPTAAMAVEHSIITHDG